MSYDLRPVRFDEMEMVFRWRNEPRVRAVMPFSDDIEFETHRKWWPGALADPERRMLVLEQAGEPVATLVFLQTRPGGSASWGFYTAPDAEISRPRALAAWTACYPAALRYGFENLQVERLRCETLETRQGALDMLERWGFVRTGALVEHAGRLFVEMEFTRAQYRARRVRRQSAVEKMASAGMARASGESAGTGAALPIFSARP